MVPMLFNILVNDLEVGIDNFMIKFIDNSN